VQNGFQGLRAVPCAHRLCRFPHPQDAEGAHYRRGYEVEHQKGPQAELSSQHTCGQHSRERTQCRGAADQFHRSFIEAEVQQVQIEQKDIDANPASKKKAAAKNTQNPVPRFFSRSHAKGFFQNEIELPAPGAESSSGSTTDSPAPTSSAARWPSPSRYIEARRPQRSAAGRWLRIAARETPAVQTAPAA